MIRDGEGLRGVYRGLDVGELIRTSDFTSVVFHHLTGRLPTKGEGRVIDAILIAGLDHTFSSAFPARIVIARSPESFQAAVATGTMSIGTRRGAAANEVAQMLLEAGASGPSDSLAERVVSDYLERSQRIPGIGNPLHKTVDPRAEGVMDVAESEGVAGVYVAAMRRIASLATKRKGRALVVNYSGSVGAAICDMGMDWRTANGLVLLARTGGVIANVIEEMVDPTYDEFFAELAKHNDVIYEGDDPRAVDDATG